MPSAIPGLVIALRGPVIDVAFDAGPLPAIEEALRVEWDQPDLLVAEVQSHLDGTTVRAVALHPTAGLRRGTAVRATGGPMAMPVGDAVLARLLDVIGEVKDRGTSLPADIQRWPIHRRPAAINRAGDGRHYLRNRY